MKKKCSTTNNVQKEEKKEKKMLKAIWEGEKAKEKRISTPLLYFRVESRVVESFMRLS